MQSSGVTYEICSGEGAFYGPKIEFTLQDCLGRDWQCGTIQVDFSTPERLGASYIGEDSSKHVPVMLHRAILGSLERFIGIILEDTAGVLWPWLAPIQAVIMSISDKHNSWSANIVKKLANNGFRVKEDLRNEKIGFKIREHTLQKVPYLLIVGDREVENQLVSVRSLSGRDLGAMQLDEFINLLALEIAQRGRKQSLVQEKNNETA